MYEKREHPLASRNTFVVRQLKHIFISLLFISFWVFGGVLGYHFFGELSWVDSLVNSSMIGSGMGPVNPINSVSGKIFESIYAIFSGVVFITNVGFIFAPIMHRIFHFLLME